MNSGKILIADDNVAVRNSLHSLLSSSPGWKICGEAVDGIDAIEKAQALHPDVILMDISMPRMNGLEAAQVIRKELPAIKVILVSQNDPEVVRFQVLEVDAAAFIPKSDLSRSLFATLDKVVGPPNREGISAKESEKEKSTSPDWLAGGGELGRMIRDHDWSNTSLGALETWPQSLKTSVNLILNSQHPMWIGWGEEATFLYNDAYIQVLSAAKHPWALGKPAAEVWREIWDVCGPLADKVFQRGEASFVNEVRLLMNRGDYVEETYYSFSYSPIRDESGAVAGLVLSFYGSHAQGYKCTTAGYAIGTLRQWLATEDDGGCVRFGRRHVFEKSERYPVCNALSRRQREKKASPARTDMRTFCRSRFGHSNFDCTFR